MLSRLLALTLICLVVGNFSVPAATARPFSPSVLTDKGDPPEKGSGSPASTYRSNSERHKLVVHSSQFAQRLNAQGTRLIADYGDFQVVEAATPLADSLVAAGSVELRDDYNLILLNAGPIDTTTTAGQVLKSAAGSFSGRRMQLVQFAGPIRPEWYAALIKTGVEVITAIPSNAYLVYGDQAALQALDQFAQQTPALQWAGSYLDRYRIHLDLLSAPTPLLGVQLYADPATNADTLALIGTLKQGTVYRQEILHYINLIVPADPSAIAQIAARPDVVSINPYIMPELHDESQDQIIAGNVTATGPVAGDYLAQLAAWGFTQAQFSASGFAVDVTDSGLDNASTSPNHFGLYVNGVRPGTSRVIYNRLQGTPHAISSLQGVDGHGTINAHIVGGYVPSSAPYNAFPHADANGLRYGLGVAPFVKIGSSVVFDPTTFTSPNFANLQSQAYQDGARISTNSWGAPVGGAYTSDAQAYDALVRDAQPAGSTFATAGNQEMVIVFSAGNDGPTGNTIGSPGTGKNVLTIGATEGVQPFGGVDGSGVDDTGANNYNDIIGFSSRGPTDDGRQKPDMVAPGTHITGGLWQTASPGADGTADPGFNGSGVSGGVGSSFFPALQQWYTASSGTSHSTPAVAGGTALVRQYFINQGLTSPSPAMTKAFLISAARYLNGVSANDTLPSPTQGMGMIDLGRSFATTPHIVRDQRSLDTFSATGQSRIIKGQISDPAQPLRVTLAWTDAPGPTSGSAFLNDLDLAVTINGTTYLGNVFSGANSTAGGLADPRNNVESVFLPAGLPAGTPFIIQITAANIIADGIPNTGGALDQDFAIAALNGIEVSTPNIEATGIILTGESFQPANGLADPGELISVDLRLRNVGIGATTNAIATLQASGGVTNPSAAQSYGAIIAGGEATRSFRLRVAPTSACGSSLTLSFQIQDGATALGTLATNLAVGTFVPSGVTSGANTAAVTINDNSAASLYPSTITLSGVTGRVLSTTVTLTGLTHTYPDDIDIALVGPGGQRVMLMSDAGGDPDVAGINLTFADGAALLPDTTQLSSGTYAPTNYEANDNLPAPAPAGPYAATLSSFHGSDPNGIWSLYIIDDIVGDTGSLSGGWSLNLTLEAPVCAAAGVSVAGSGLTTSEAGGTATFDVVLNRAPTANVTIGVSSSNLSEGTVSPASLTFTPTNWYEPQVVTARGVRDALVDGTATYTIMLAPAISTDSAYNGMNPTDVSVANSDSYNIFLPLTRR